MTTLNIRDLLERIIADQHLSTHEMQRVIEDCMSGQLNDVQISAFLALMRMKGETPDELTAAAKVMQTRAHRIDLGNDLIDIVGTGGDGLNTFNISTVCCFVVAATGLKVAKHGNRSVSSRSGSADLLSHAGFELHLSEHALQTCMQQCNIAFLFAPHFHEALQHVKTARQQLGIRTLFNLLGPLINPAHVKRQVVGVFAQQWMEPLAHVLAELGSERALVVHANDGLDEISVSANTEVIEYHHGTFKHWTLDPKEYDCYHPSLDAIVIDSPKESLSLAQSVFSGEKGPARDIVLLNSAAAIYCADACATFQEAIEKAAFAIDSGNAYQCFHQLRSLTQSLKGSS
jgi:anthranilate phosphoribosyltransferase